MKDRKAFTLIEVVLTVAILSMLLLIGTNIFIIGNKAQSFAIDEFDVQTNTRIISEYIMNITKDATKVHTIPKSSFQDADVRDPRTSYIGVSKEGHVVIDEPGEEGLPREIQYIAKKQDGIEYEIIYEESKEIEKLIKFKIIGTKNGRKISEISSSVEVLNALQIEHLGSKEDPAVALGFTTAKMIGQDSYLIAPDAYVVMVLDTSGSMSSNLDGYSTRQEGEQRIEILQEKAEEMIHKLSKFEFDVYLSIVPFSENANPTESGHEFISLQRNKQDALNIISALKANGATNTGDGIRRAYHLLKNKGDTLINNGKVYNDFTMHMMVLVDGETNRASRRIDSTKEQCFLFWCWNIVDKDSYAENDKNITSNVKTGENRVVSVGENDNKYITHLGNRLVQQYTFNDAGESKQVIKSFVIGFSNVGKDHNSLKAIGEALNSRKFTHNNGEPFIIANDPRALEFAFESFTSDIYDDLWMLMRPQLVN